VSPQKKSSTSTQKGKKADLPPTGISEVDGLADLSPCTIKEYIGAVSAYVRGQRSISKGAKKAAQIRLSNALGRALVHDLEKRIPSLRSAHVGERKVAGALRTTNADVSQIDELDGLRLAVELKPVNLAVGRAIWNRFGDLRTFAVNIHLKFPFCVIGGVLVIPTYEEVGTNEAKAAEEQEEEVVRAGDDMASLLSEPMAPPYGGADEPETRSTVHLIERAIQRLIRAGGRKTEADAAHLLEGIAVVAYDPKSGTLEAKLPPEGSGLRWDEFVEALAKSYLARFE
jgi:hypothetical protein